MIQDNKGNEARERPSIAGGMDEPTVTDERHYGSDKTPAKFNRYLYENVLVHLEGQIESWNHKAVRDPNPEAAHALWLKAEGLDYALRLLYALEPEFRELVECASLGAEIKDPGSTVQRLERKSP